MLLPVPAVHPCLAVLQPRSTASGAPGRSAGNQGQAGSGLLVVVIAGEEIVSNAEAQRGVEVEVSRRKEASRGVRGETQPGR